MSTSPVVKAAQRIQGQAESIDCRPRETEMQRARARVINSLSDFLFSVFYEDLEFFLVYRFNDDPSELLDRLQTIRAFHAREVVKQLSELVEKQGFDPNPNTRQNQIIAWLEERGIEERLPLGAEDRIESEEQLCQLLLDYWRRESPGVIEVDLAKVQSAADLLSLVARSLALQGEFGNNLDQFWEAAAAGGVMPRRLLLRNWQGVESTMARDFELLQELLRELGKEYLECAMDIELA